MKITEYGPNIPSKLFQYLQLTPLTLLYQHFCQHLQPLESIIKIYKYVRTLRFEDAPDYDKMKYFIIKDLEQQGKTLDGEFEWNSLG